MNKATLLCLVTAVTAGVALFSGCGSDGGDDGDGGAGACFDYSTFDGSTPEVSLRDDVLPIFQRSCALSTACHGDAGSDLPGQHYLGESIATTMTDDQIADVLSANVNVASVKGGSMRVIVPGDAENSFMMAKLDGLCASNLACTNNDCGDTMPQLADLLKQDERDLIRRWIEQGAKDN